MAADELAGRFTRSSSVLWRATSDGAMILLPSAEEPLALNRPAAALWHLLDEPTAFGTLCEDLAEIFGVDARQIEPDVHDALSDLIQRGALERVR